MNELLLGSGSRRVLVGYGWLLTLFVILPSLVLVPVSLSSDPGLSLHFPGLTFAWYDRLLADERWRGAALLSVRVALFASIAATLLGVPAALGMSRAPPPWSKILKLLFISPLIVPLMVIGVGFYVLFAKARLLGRFWSLGLAHAVLVLPVVIMPVAARLQSLDASLERAAASLGAGPYRALARVVLPTLVPAILAGFAFAFIFSFDEVVVAQFLSGPALETLPRLMWEGISMGGLDKTITAVTTVQLALALAAMLIAGLARPRKSPLPALSSEAPESAPPGDARSTVSAKPSGTLPSLDGRTGLRITFDRLVKRYGVNTAVDAFSLDVAPGEFLSVLGPSGSGKTTLLMLIAGFTTPDEGRLLFGDRDISLIPPHRRDIGVVFQSYALFPHLDVRRNVAFPLEMRGVSAARIREQVDLALARVQMRPYAERRIGQLSGGQQQRVALARSIVFNPCALLMDEPLAALDRNLRQDMQIELRALTSSLGQTVIYVTHDQEEAINLSDRIAVMHGGRLQQVGSPKDLYLRPQNAFVAGFFGEANLFEGDASTDGLRLASGIRVPIADRTSGRRLLCIRPEVVQIGIDAPNFPHLVGTILETRFQGAVARAVVDTPIGRMIVKRQIDSLQALPASGETVRLSWNPDMTHTMQV